MCVYIYYIYTCFFKYIQYITFLEWSRSSETMEIPNKNIFYVLQDEYLSIHLSIYPFIHLSIYRCIDLPLCALYHHISPDTVNGLFLAPHNSLMSGLDGHGLSVLFWAAMFLRKTNLGGDVKPTYDIIILYTSWGPQL